MSGVWAAAVIVAILVSLAAFLIFEERHREGNKDIQRWARRIKEEDKK